MQSEKFALEEPRCRAFLLLYSHVIFRNNPFQKLSQICCVEMRSHIPGIAEQPESQILGGILKIAIISDIRFVCSRVEKYSEVRLLHTFKYPATNEPRS